MLKSRMRLLGLLMPILLLALLLFASASPSRAAGCEDKIARHMVGEAMLAAQFVAAAEKNGMTASAINAVLKDIAANSAIQEFWITDSSGHAYLTNTGVDFTFSPDAAKQPQASAFWPLITGAKKVVIQAARKREIDNQIFKYVGVAGVDKPRIVQVGVSAANLCK
jgi:adenylate cyclase